MNNHKRTNASKQEKRNHGKSNAVESTAAKGGDLILNRAMRQIADGKYQKALGLLQSAGSELHVRNAIGVCLLRMGRTEDAMPLFRAIVLAPGCTWTRPNTPTVYQTNFATSLLMGGHPSGCEEILAGIADKSHPSVLRLTRAIEQWVKSLTFWQKMNWWFGRVEPKHCRVEIDFVPGDFEGETVLPDNPQTPNAHSTNVTAA